VGRVLELGVASDALAAAAAGRGSVLSITGEGGIGKSRLAEEIAVRAEARGMAVVWAAGWPGAGAEAYWPWPEIVAAVQGDDDGWPAPGAEADSERFGRFRSVTRLLQQRAAERPLVIVLDDTHTVDADGLLLTRFVARSTAKHRMLLVLPHRTSPDVGAPALELLGEIGREGAVVRLHGLGRDEVRDLVAATGEPVQPSVVHRVQELTAGNPFLVEQVLDSGLHRRDRSLPDAARRLLDAQLGALDPSTQAVLEAAAVLGPGASPSEVAAVGAADPVAVERARRAGVDAGLVEPERGAVLAFTHELARDAVLARLGSERMAALHRSCLTALAGDDGSPDRAVRRARHALALARCVADETAGAVEIVRTSAVALRTGAPELAVELLRDALAAHEPVGVRPSPTLLVELGEAELATGRLTDARLHFRAAVAAADALGDRHTYARAAIGLGGVWVREHRGSEDRRAYHEIVDRALELLAGDESAEAASLTAMLRLRRATEHTAAGTGPMGDALAALDEVRRLDDPAALARGLSLVHHVMLGPEHAAARDAVAAELLDVARASGDELQVLMGMMWATADALLAGQPADRELAELRERADALGMQAILFVTDAIDVMRLMRAGDLDAAERAAHACLERGTEVGDADASTYFGAHLLALHWYRGTAVELLDVAEELSASTAMAAESRVFSAVVAALAAESGDVDRAQRALARVGRGRLADIPPDSTWMSTMFALVEAAVFLDDARLADEVGALLEPYRDLPMMGSLAVCCLGPTERALGLAARVVGRADDAIAYLERAVEAVQALGNCPVAAITRAELAETLLGRDAPGDRERAGALLVHAITEGERAGLETRVRRWAHQRERAAGPAEPVVARCERDALRWELTTDCERATVRHTVGMEYLATLLATPRTEVPAGSLAGVHITAGAQEVYDSAALADLRRRMTQLEDDLDRATVAGRADEVRTLQRELDDIVAVARAATGKGGRSRLFDDATERARTSVQKAIRRAIANVGRDAPKLATALEASVHTGYWCRYEPRAGAPERWVVRRD
jgi:tetratricopeptide (TPR) repeat protein